MYLKAYANRYGNYKLKYFYRPKLVARACIREVLIQVWSELLDKQVNAQKEFKKSFQVSRKLSQAHEKVCNENERNKQKSRTCKIIDGRREFIEAQVEDG